MSILALSSLLLFGTFFVLLFVGVPICIAILTSSCLTAFSFIAWDQALFVMMQKMTVGIENFNLLALPLFILSGNIMNNGGIARRLIAFAQLMVGRLPGSLAQTNVLANMFFGSVSGSGVAAAAAIGGTMAPIQEEEGYDPDFCAAVNVASAPCGMVIPPSSAFIMYSLVAGGVSIAALFVAGYVPGILMGLAVMLVAYLYARKHNYPTVPPVPRSEVWRITMDALPSLMLIVIVIGGIVGGVFTATEGAAIAVVYPLALSLYYRNLSWASFKSLLVSSAGTSGIILLLISASSAMSWVMSFSGIPSALSRLLLSLSDNPYMILLLMNLLLLIVGTFLDMTPAILIFTPIFLPIVTKLGMDPVHFGVVLIMNLCIGTITPPVGSVLFVGCSVAKSSIERVTRQLMPHFAVLILLLLVVTYVPALSLALPKFFNLM